MYKYAEGSLVAQFRVMALLPVILLSLLQGSFSKTVKTGLPHYTLEMRPGCPANYVEVMPAASAIDCGTKMIEKNIDGLVYDEIGDSCFLLDQEEGPVDCWRLVPSS